MVAIATQLEQELADIGLGREKHEQNCFGRHHRDNCHAAAIFEHRGNELGAPNRSTEFVGGSDNRRNERRDSLGVDGGNCLPINEKTVAPEHDGRFDSFALSNRSHEIPDAGQLESSRKVVAKLEIVNIEVKR